MFERSRSKASREAYKTAKAVQAEAFGSQAKTHPAFEDPEHKIDAATDARRQDLLASIYTYNPSETIFEIGVRGQQATTVLINIVHDQSPRQMRTMDRRKILRLLLLYV
jgi:ATP-dependent RNA helicase DDX54/DBP10